MLRQKNCSVRGGASTGVGEGALWNDNGAQAELDRTLVCWALKGSNWHALEGKSHLCLLLGQIF